MNNVINDISSPMLDSEFPGISGTGERHQEFLGFYRAFALLNDNNSAVLFSLTETRSAPWTSWEELLEGIGLSRPGNTVYVFELRHALNALWDVGKSDLDYLQTRGFKYVRKTTLYYRQRGIRAVLLQNESNSYLFVDKYSPIIFASIPILAPWLVEDGTTEDAMGFLRIIDSSGGNEEAINDYLLKNEKVQSLEKRAIANTATAMCVRAVKEKIKQNKELLDDAYETVRELKKRIGSEVEEIRKLNALIAGYESSAKDEGIEELSSFLVRMKDKIRVQADPQSHGFIAYVFTTMNNFDPEVAKRFLEKGVFQNRYQDFIPYARRIPDEFLKKVFVTREYTVRMFAAYQIEDVYVEGVLSKEKPCLKPDDYMYNPHIGAYGCLGSYAEPMNDAAIENDYITLLMLCLTSAGSLDLGDSVVTKSFLEDLANNYDKKIIECDCELLTVREAIERTREDRNGQGNHTDNHIS